ncbi:MAG: hypothetical protein F4Z53_09195 [Acidimicrobiales bacterium]|nr:hypothetical protein [Acidimicrobiales bacterium]MYD34152.1 hypothetical protein [Acidimicrobiales bacterium]MYI08112.1 hypothetical protein [Acidimicrobiales bacterium]
MAELELPGLSGNNPLGFMAALGVQVALAETNGELRLGWTDSLVPAAIVNSEFDVDEIVARVVSVSRSWASGPALNPAPSRDDVKFPANAIRDYLDQARGLRDGALAASLVAENSLDAVSGTKAKPTDLDFTSGNQKLLDMMRRVLTETSPDDIAGTVLGAWQYSDRLPSLGWDVVDDRQYALEAFNPTDSKNNPKLSCPGAQCLAILGMVSFSAFRGGRKTATTACHGTWNQGCFSWPLWAHPVSLSVSRTLISHASIPPDDVVSAGSDSLRSRSRQFAGWGLFQVLASNIDRSSKYGRFGPPRVIWQRD